MKFPLYMSFLIYTILLSSCDSNTDPITYPVDYEYEILGKVGQEVFIMLSANDLDLITPQPTHLDWLIDSFYTWVNETEEITGVKNISIISEDSVIITLGDSGDIYQYDTTLAYTMDQGGNLSINELPHGEFVLEDMGDNTYSVCVHALYGISHDQQSSNVAEIGFCSDGSLSREALKFANQNNLAESDTIVNMRYFILYKKSN